MRKKGFTLRLTPEQRSYLTIELNLELRHCDPHGYPNRDSYVVSAERATILNDLFKQLTGGDHESYERWYKKSQPANETVA